MPTQQEASQPIYAASDRPNARPAGVPAAEVPGEARPLDTETGSSPLKTVVLIPCYNEEQTIGKVVADFREALPEAEIYVYDNNSQDATREIAAAAGAIVREEPLQGKGNVVRRMFSDIEADIYVMVDGDDTYHAASAPSMIQRLLDDQLDMVNGARDADATAYRPGHQWGNVFLTQMVALVFGSRFNDMLSGFRVFSRRFVKSFPALSGGFEIETELTVHALELRMKVVEMKTPFQDRPEGSLSKLRTIHDGVKILRTIVWLVKEERPLPFFSILFAVLAGMSLVLGIPVVSEYMATGLVPRFPTAILATGLMLLGFLCLACGLILDTVTRGRKELKRLWFLSEPEASHRSKNTG